MQLNAITRKSALMAILLLVAILVAVSVRYYLSPYTVEEANCEYQGYGVSIVFAVLIYLSVGVVVGRVFPRSGLNKGYCTFPISLYGVLACGLFFAPYGVVTALTSLCFAVAIYLLLRSLHVAGEKDSVFFASMLLGTTVLLYPPCIVLAGAIPMAIFILALSLRQTLIMIAGYALPFLTASYYMWYRGCDFLQLGRNFVEILHVTRMDTIEDIPYVAIVLIAVIAISLIWGAIYVAIRPDKMLMLARVRRALLLFVSISLLTFTMLFIPACDLTLCAIVAVPLSILLSFVLNLLPNNHSTALYWTILALVALHLFLE